SHCRTASPRPSIEIKAEESRTVDYDELSSVCIADLVEDSSNEVSLIIVYSEHVIWKFIHVLSSRAEEGSEDGGSTPVNEVN
ncbi:hypothetical protein PMAYCL1PPCAC_07789, partial [Pristionchus mayeri]